MLEMRASNMQITPLGSGQALPLIGRRAIRVQRMAVMAHVVANNSCDVAVVGGGPAGLAAAKAVLAACPGTSVQVFEGSGGYKYQGAGVLLNINGWRALDAISSEVQERLWDQSMPLSRSRVFDEDGTPDESGQLMGIAKHEENMEKFGYTQRLASWSDIRQALYLSLPEGTVQFGQKLEDLEIVPSGDEVLLRFGREAVDDSVESIEVKARFVIGADGFFSKTRQAVLADGPPDFTGRVTWRGRANPEPGSPLAAYVRENEATSFVWINRETIGKDRSAVMYPLPDGSLIFTANAPVWRMEEKGIEFEPFKTKSSVMVHDSGSEGETAKERCLEVMGDYPEEFLNVVRSVDAGSITEHGFYLRPAEKMPEGSWGKGPVTLAGDAAHLMPPDGQGLNLAMEDAAVLMKHLEAKGLSEQALRGYEAARIPRVKAILSLQEWQPGRAEIIQEDCLQQVI